MTMKRYLDPKNDVAFKKIFGAEEHKACLMSFLNSIFELKEDRMIQQVEFLNPFQAPKIEGKKLSFIDVLCTDQRGIHYVIEMQLLQTKGFEKRVQYYASKTYAAQVNKGEDYPKLNQVLFLAIANYDLFPHKDHYKSTHLILDKETFDHDLQDLQFTFLELPKFTKSQAELETVEDKWLYFLKHARDIDGIPESMQEEPLKEAFQALEQYGWNEAEMRAYEDFSLALVDQRAAGEFKYEQGLKQGMEKGIETVALSMLHEGISIEVVTKITGLSEAQIKILGHSF